MATTRKTSDPLRDQFVERDAEAKRVLGFDPLNDKLRGLPIGETAVRFLALPTITDADGTVLVQKKAVEQFEKDREARERKAEMTSIAEKVLWENLTPAKYRGEGPWGPYGSPLPVVMTSRSYYSSTVEAVEIEKPVTSGDLAGLRRRYRWGLALTAVSSAAAVATSIFAVVS